MTVTTETVRFTSGPGLSLHGVLYMPSEENRPAGGLPGIVLCLGYRPVFGMFAPKYARGFAEMGYAVLTFEYRGFGSSEGPRWRHIAHEQLEDVRNAVTYLSTRDEVDDDRIAVWGDASYGGAHAVMAGATDDRIRCVVATTPFADGEALLRSTRAPWEWQDFTERVAADRRERVLGRGEQVPPEEIMNFEPASHVRAAKHAEKHPELAALRYPLSETADSIMSYKPVEYVDRLSPRPLLLIAAELDRTTPASNAEQLYEAAGSPKKLVILKNAGHTDVHGSRLADVMEIGADWLARHLSPRDEDIVLTEGSDTAGAQRESAVGIGSRAVSPDLRELIEKEAIS
ncbi:alpha/beta hydrolase [Rhodococcus sp. NPDC057529]|uniref:alpha/beta hydrolase n=1 Tax=Rhodococcus sp. NPDC057529 TaxID=3346158 RepID=UPI00367349C5